ncbi:ParB/RepB/Spo0J family partition protein [Melioribacteraceae bacterium 4301-Me]|uniref:ParB/RepB/Spo0J family partition protein n=1 Tax=Pyranulibacter aquaticus TaxID=3163344 RepID=UPI00359543F5
MKPGLGRGLDALINPTANKTDSPIAISIKEIQADDGKSIDYLAKIPIDKILPNPFQPRTEFDQDALDELKKSILQNGLIQPITVRRNEQNGYELISGERRLRACKEIGYKEIPAYIIKVDSKEAMLALSLIENIQREKLNPIEIANAYKRLMDECNLTQEEIAAKVGKDRTTITNTIRLLKLPKEIQQAIISNSISMGHARALINLPNETLQIELMNKIIKKNLSVRKVEEFVRTFTEKINEVNKNKNIQHTNANVSQQYLEEKLQKILGTKVKCSQNKKGSGKIIVEFYSNEELERLLELFELIDKTYN